MVTHFIVRHLRTSVGLAKKCHYETLGIAPSASQADVKAAYYRKSMELHPDRVQGNREHFEEVANAYKILSDPAIRKLYDRRVRTKNVNCDSRSKSGFPSNLGKTPVYDFDQWTRRHYGGVLRRNETRAGVAQARNALADEREKENVTLALMSLILCAVFITLIGADQRKNKPRNRPPNPDKRS